MLRFLHEQQTRSGRLSRRERLPVGGLGLAALAASEARGQTQTKSAGFGKAKSVILVFCSGGQSQLDMWDPKPAAPLDVRSVFRPISTAVPGVYFTEHMPRIAKVAD